MIPIKTFEDLYKLTPGIIVCSFLYEDEKAFAEIKRYKDSKRPHRFAIIKDYNGKPELPYSFGISRSKFFIGIVNSDNFRSLKLEIVEEKDSLYNEAKKLLSRS